MKPFFIQSLHRIRTSSSLFMTWPPEGEELPFSRLSWYLYDLKTEIRVPKEAGYDVYNC